MIRTAPFYMMHYLPSQSRRSAEPAPPEVEHNLSLWERCQPERADGEGKEDAAISRPCCFVVYFVIPRTLSEVEGAVGISMQSPFLEIATTSLRTGFAMTFS